MNEAVLLRLKQLGLKIDPFYIPYIDNIEDDYLLRERLENIDEINKTATVGIETCDSKKVEKCLCEETQKRIGERGIQELARNYRILKDDWLPYFQV